MAAPPKDVKGSFIGEWQPVDLTYASGLVSRGLLEEDRLSWRDPTCQECGHRAWDHGLANLPVKERLRWFREEPTACQWKECGCQVWRPYLHAKHPVEYVGQVRMTDAWVEVPLGRSWIVAYRIVNDRGTPVVGELRVFPAEEGRPGFGRWSGDVLGANAKVPRRGITSRQLRGVRVRAYQRYMAEQVEQFREKAPDLAQRYGWGRGAATDTRITPETGTLSLAGTAPRVRRGRKGRPDEFYAGIAAEYARAVERGSRRPIADIACRRKFEVSRVRDMVRQARKRGLLTREGAGLRGGVLTDRGLELVRKK